MITQQDAIRAQSIIEWKVTYLCYEQSAFSAPLGTETRIFFDRYSPIAFEQAAPIGWEITAIERTLRPDA